ncbi:putative copia-like polyprotein [Tanacetum coccineum]
MPIFSLWHDKLGHPGSTMMKMIVENTHGHPLKDQKFPKINKVPLCASCSLGKLIARHSPLKVENESPMFLERIQDTKRVTKSHIPAPNAPTQVEMPNKQDGDNIKSQKRLKCGRPIDIKTSPKEEMNDINKEISINYSQTHILWDRNEIGDIDEIFSYSIASDIMSGNDEPKFVIDCQNLQDWDNGKTLCKLN